MPPVSRRFIAILGDILAASQEFMRNQKVITTEIFLKTNIEEKHLIVSFLELSSLFNRMNVVL